MLSGAVFKQLGSRNYEIHQRWAFTVRLYWGIQLDYKMTNYLKGLLKRRCIFAKRLNLKMLWWGARMNSALLTDGPFKPQWWQRERSEMKPVNHWWRQKNIYWLKLLFTDTIKDFFVLLSCTYTVQQWIPMDKHCLNSCNKWLLLLSCHWKTSVTGPVNETRGQMSNIMHCSECSVIK